MDWDWDWAIGGITDETPRTTGPECINYMTNRRRWTESFLLSLLFIYIMYTSWKRLEPIKLPPLRERDKPHSAVRLLLLISMSTIFGIEMGFKLAGRSMLFALNPCHVQTCVQIYLLAAKPSKLTTAMFRIQLNNLNGPFLAFMFPEVEGRSYAFEQATYWIQHALLYIIPMYMLRSGAYTVEDMHDFNWVKIGTAFMLFYHFTLLNGLSILTGINVDHMLCAALSDPFQGQNYRIAACLHECLLCPILNKGTVWLCRTKKYDDAAAVSGAAYSSDKAIISNTNINCSCKCETECDNIKCMNRPLDHTIYQQIKSNEQTYETPNMDEHRDDCMLRQRFSNFEELTNTGCSTIGDIAAEYTMPTTKID